MILLKNLKCNHKAVTFIKKGKELNRRFQYYVLKPSKSGCYAFRGYFNLRN